MRKTTELHSRCCVDLALGLASTALLWSVDAPRRPMPAARASRAAPSDPTGFHRRRTGHRPVVARAGFAWPKVGTAAVGDWPKPELFGRLLIFIGLPKASRSTA